MSKRFTKVIAIIGLIMILLMVLNSCSLFTNNEENNSVDSVDKDKETIKKPIEKVNILTSSQALTINDTIELKLNVEPADNDDTLIFESGNENILTIKDNIIKAVGFGSAGIIIKTKSGKINKSIGFLVQYKNSQVVNQTSYEKQIKPYLIKIKNKCYNTVLGIPSKSETIEFTGVLFKRVGSDMHYFITANEGFKKIDGYKYQKWTAVDWHGKEHNIDYVYSEQDKPMFDNTKKLAIGCIEGFNMPVLTIGNSKGYYYDKENLFICDTEYFIDVNKRNTDAGTSPMGTNLHYGSDLLGSAVMDYSFNFVGIVIGAGQRGETDFIPLWYLNEFIDAIMKQLHII